MGGENQSSLLYSGMIKIICHRKMDDSFKHEDIWLEITSFGLKGERMVRHKNCIVPLRNRISSYFFYFSKFKGIGTIQNNSMDRLKWQVFLFNTFLFFRFHYIQNRSIIFKYLQKILFLVRGKRNHIKNKCTYHIYLRLLHRGCSLKFSLVLNACVPIIKNREVYFDDHKDQWNIHRRIGW